MSEADYITPEELLEQLRISCGDEVVEAAREWAHKTIQRLGGKERAAFEAGLDRGYWAGRDYEDVDDEQEWQQYRCQDPTDFRIVRDEEDD
jgi:hypothetical protein